MIITFLAVLGCIHVTFMLAVEFRRMRSADAAIERLEVEVGDLEAEAARLEAVITHGDDDRYREQLARRQGFMLPDETRVVIIGVP